MSTQNLTDKDKKAIAACRRLIESGNFILVNDYYVRVTEEMAKTIDINDPDAPQAVIDYFKQQYKDGTSKALAHSEILAALTKDPNMPNNIARRKLGAKIAAEAAAKGMTPEEYANGVPKSEAIEK